MIPRSGQNPLRFTDHNAPLIFSDESYSPVGGFDQSATELASGLKEQNIDVVGVIESDYITNADLRAGKWQGATVFQYLVDWRAAWIGALRTRKFTIGNIEFTGETWLGELNGLSHELNNQHGRAFTRPCNARLGDSRCGVNLDTFTDGKFTAVDVDDGSQDSDEPRRIFAATVASLSGSSLADDWFNYGKIVWTVGENANSGVESEVKDYTHTGRVIELYEPTPFAIADSDQFTIFVGCDYLASTCKDKFNNLVNHRGIKFMPGTDKVLTVP